MEIRSYNKWFILLWSWRSQDHIVLPPCTFSRCDATSA